ncbi:MAG TPA: DUF4097 family beta strand repeat-containing protein [Lacunisphaera sp.]|nr:DUF4097 family beta strand repeat-containing protein [Lacunisphaera sp.]
MTLKELRVPALIVAGFVLAAAAAHASVTEHVSKTFPLTTDGAIKLDNVNGDIEITGWDKPEVSVEAEKKGKTDEDLQRVDIQFDSSADRLVIKTKYEKTGWFHGNVNASVHYKLMVPAGARLEKIDSVNSGIKVRGVQGAVDLETVNGGIDAAGLAADAHVESVNGSLRVEFASTDKVREVKIESVNGGAEVVLPKGASARIHTSSVNGGHSIDQPIKLSKSGRHHFSGEIGSGGPDVSIETVNGGIHIREK